MEGHCREWDNCISLVMALNSTGLPCMFDIEDLPQEELSKPPLENRGNYNYDCFCSGDCYIYSR
jgi:hypothetical protein